MHPSTETTMPDRDVMLGMSDEDFVGLWQRIVGERPAVLIARGEMVSLLADLQDEMRSGSRPEEIASRAVRPGDAPPRRDGTATPA